MAKKLRILVLNLTAALGGAERSLLSLAQKIDRDRFHLTLAVPSEGPLAEGFRQAGHDAFVDGVRQLPARSVPAAGRLLRTLLGESRRRGIDLVHSNGIWRLHRAAALSMIARTPALCHVRDLDERALSSWKFRLSSRVVRKLVAISGAVRTSLVRHGVPERRIVTIPNGIDIEAFGPTEESGRMRSLWGVREGDFLVGIAGQIEPRKGHLDFLEAARAVALDCPSARFVVIGGDLHGIYGEYRKEVEDAAMGEPLSGKVIFAGMVEHMPAAMGALDLLVVPSRSEPFGRVAVEAMAASRPVVAYGVDGLAEIVENGRTGITVAPGDRSALGSAIAKLAGHRERAREMGRHGRERARALFPLDAHVRAMEDLYEREGRNCG